MQKRNLCPCAVYFVLIKDNERITEFCAKDADPRKWQPYEPGDADYKPLRHKFGIQSRLQPGLKPGHYQLGLWLPDAYQSLRLDSRYSVRVANRDIPWWTDADGSYGVNILGDTQIVP